MPDESKQKENAGERAVAGRPGPDPLAGAAPKGPTQSQGAAGSPPAPAVAAGGTPGQAEARPTGPGGQPHPEATTGGVPVAPLSEAQRLARLEQIAIQSRPPYSVGPTPGIDKTVPGGKFMVDGRWLNADGEEIDEQGKLLHPERARKDQFGRMTTIR